MSPFFAALLSVSLAAPPDILTLRRPAGGEWSGIYLLGHKAGFAFSQVSLGKAAGGERVLTQIDDTTIRATLGGKAVSRRVREVKTYSARPKGPLLSLEALHEGDGGDVAISATFDVHGAHVVRTPKGGAPETLELPPTKDTVENADLPRLAAARHSSLSGEVFDSTSLRDKLEELRDLGPGELRAAGSSARVERVSVTEDRGTVAATVAVDLGSGRILETRFGGALLAVPEPEAVAKKLGTVDLFALTRVAVDKPLPTGVVPATVVYRVSGLPLTLRPESNRQAYHAATSGAVDVTVRANAPTAHRLRSAGSEGLPAEVASELVATPAIESTDPAIQKLAREIVGDENDSQAAAERLSRWVYQHIHSAYGVSSDRASDVLKLRQGDCTEHSLLLTALARAAGIPARLVYGLVYAQGADGAPGLFWHEWVEIFAGDWFSIDPTFGQDVADATHLQLGRGDQTDAVALMGQLKISVVSINRGAGQTASAPKPTKDSPDAN